MTKMIKGATIVALAALGMSLSACGSETANANATPTQDSADLTAAAIDSAPPAAVPAPSDAATPAPTATASTPAH